MTYFLDFAFDDHFLIHSSIAITDSTSSCPLVVNRYSTLGGISLSAYLGCKFMGYIFIVIDEVRLVSRITVRTKIPDASAIHATN